ncbi:MAG: translocation/assembly module TamB, partial [Deltaproteobacteria bacterium]|nr:translocation/assembly module TamB [Deltaproteobacteria bacterium]
GRGLDSEWEGKLRVGGTAATPEVRGELSIVRGRYDFLGERFSLASGTVFFDGSSPPKPMMEITAERRKADMTGRVILSGTPSTLSIRVASEPPMPQDEVMARLLFDRSLASITPVQALKLARAMDSLAGGGRLGFLDRAQSAVGLDQVEIVQTGEEGGSTALSLGKYVSEDAYVEVEKGLGADESKVSVEYEVTPRITVETEVGVDSAGGVEVKWKWDY